MSAPIDQKALLTRLAPLVVIEGVIVAACGVSFILTRQMIWVYLIVGAVVILGSLIVFQLIQARGESGGGGRT